MPSRRMFLLSALGLALSGCTRDDQGVSHLSEQKFSAGAGKAWVSFDGMSWPIDGYDHQHDAPGVRVLLMQFGSVRFAIVVLDITSIADELLSAAKSVLATQAQVLAENCFLCASHSFSIPRIFPLQHLPSDADVAQNNLLHQRFLLALTQAVKQAVIQLQPARLGFGSGTSFVNINRDQHYDNGWWLGADKNGFSDPWLGMLRIDDSNGKPFAAVFNYAVQSSVTEGAHIATQGRQISADLAGMASGYLEEHGEDGMVALFLVGGAADQAPRVKARHYQSYKGQPRMVQDPVDPFILLQQLAQRLGNDALQLLQTIKTHNTPPLTVVRQVLSLPAIDFSPQNPPSGPVTQHNYPRQGTRPLPVSYMVIGEAVWVGLQPELCAQTVADIRQRSPFRYTFVSTLVDGAAKYLPDQLSFDRITYEARSSFYAAGSAETASKAIIDSLNRLKRNGSDLS